MLAALAAGCLPGTGCGKPGAKPDAAKDSVRAVVIGPENYTVVAQRRIESGPAISGTLTPKDQAMLRAQVSGAVLGTFADQGQRVGRGTLLARIDARAIRDAVTAAQAAVRNAQSSLDMARHDEERMRSLKDIGAIAEREVENAHRATVAAETGLAQTRAQLVSAQKQLTLTEVHAPITGVVSIKQVSTGDIVQPGTALYTIVDPSSLELEASIAADQLSVVKVGTPVQFSVNGYPGRTFTGTIVRINPTADPATRQVKVFAEIPNYGNELLGDLFAQGRVATQSHTGLAVPATAIDRRMMKPAVMKLDGGKVKRVDVALGLSDEQSGNIEIISGVALGDTLLIGPATQITQGTQVRVTGTPAKQAAVEAAEQPRQTP
jgi:RND family efflux transporter MFP subunit